MLKEETIPQKYLDNYLLGTVIRFYTTEGKDTLVVKIVHPESGKPMNLNLSVDPKQNSKRHQQIKEDFGVEPHLMNKWQVHVKLQSAFAKASDQYDWNHNLEIYPINPKQEPKPMLIKHDPIEIAAKEVAKEFNFDWERITSGNRARCYRAVRTVIAVMNGRFTIEGIEIEYSGDADAEGK